MNRMTVARFLILLLTPILLSAGLRKDAHDAVEASARMQPGAQPARSDPQNSAAKTDVSWKKYVSSEYGFEIAYPAHWEFDDKYEDNYGKPPSAGRRPAYAGETRNLFEVEKDGPTQSDEGGDFSDGAIVTVHITGTSGIVEDWNIRSGQTSSLVKSTPADFVESASSWIGGETIKVSLDTNGFSGLVTLACTGQNPCTSPEAEGGGAYRVLPSGRVLLIDWERMNGANGLSYQRYFLPMLASFKLRQ